MTRVVLVVDGGCLQTVYADGPVDVTVVDFDNEQVATGFPVDTLTAPAEDTDRMEWWLES